MRNGVKEVVVGLGLPRHGMTPNNVGIDSLRVGGTISLKLNGISDTTIKKSRRWTSISFM